MLIRQDKTRRYWLRALFPFRVSTLGHRGVCKTPTSHMDMNDRNHTSDAPPSVRG